MTRPANPFAPRGGHVEKARQIKDWVRDLYVLDAADVVSVTELACRDAGCPDIETVIGIMREGAPIETVRIHKPLAQIERSDLHAR